jgi:hypothetical protein
MHQLKASYAARVEIIETVESSLESMPSFTGEDRCDLTTLAQLLYMDSAGGKTDVFAFRQFIEGIQLLLTIGPSFAFWQLPIGYNYSFGVTTQKIGVPDDTEERRRQTASAHLGSGFCEGLIAGVVWHATMMERAGMAMEVEGRMLA